VSRPRRINEIIHGTRAITADTALRLARYLGTSAAFWLNLQTQHDLEVQKDKLGRRLEREIPRHATAASRSTCHSRQRDSRRAFIHL
jgi:antitoxin HigA-1